MNKVDLFQVLESSHPQKGFQQRALPQGNLFVKFEAEDLEVTSRAAQLSEDLNPEATAPVDASCNGELFIYSIQSQPSKNL